MNIDEFKILNAEIGVSRSRDAARDRALNQEAPGRHPAIGAEAGMNRQAAEARDAASKVGRTFDEEQEIGPARDAGADEAGRDRQNGTRSDQVKDDAGKEDDPDGQQFTGAGETFDGDDAAGAPPADVISGILTAGQQAPGPEAGPQEPAGGDNLSARRSIREFMAGFRRPAGQSPFRLRWPFRLRQVVLAGTVLVVLAILTVGLIGTVRNGTEQTAPPPSVPALEGTPGGEVQRSSPEYRATLAEANDAGTAQAIATGADAFIPTVEDLAEPIPDAGTEPARPEDGPGPAASGELPPEDASWEIAAEAATEIPSFEPLGPLAPLEVEGGFAQDAVDRAFNPMLEHLTALAERPLPRMGSQTFSPPPAAAPEPSAAAQTASGLAGQAPGGGRPESGMRVGDMARARMLNSLSSDLPGPAIAEIVEGPLAGARVSGSFSVVRSAGGFALNFTSISMPDGRTLPISAIGLSPWTGGQVTRSRLDPRLLQRYGGLVFSGAVTGAAGAIADSATRTTVSNGTVIVDREGATGRQIAAAGIGRAASAVAGDLAGRIPTGALIELDRGTPIAVLFTTSGHSPEVQPAPPGPAGAATALAGERDSGVLPPFPGLEAAGTGPSLQEFLQPAYLPEGVRQPAQ